MKNMISCQLLFLLISIFSACSNIYGLQDFNEVYNNDYTDYYNNDNDSYVCSYEKYMSLTPTGKNGAQGSACYEDYFIQGYATNDCITIYNIKDKVCLANINISNPSPSNSTHTNTINFGSQKYDVHDYFPLLYISSGYQTDGISFLYVYRLQKDVIEKVEQFSISLVQTLSLHLEGWTEGIIDSDSDYMWIKCSKGNQNTFAKFKVPNVKEGDVDIYYEKSLDVFTLDKLPLGSRNQGCLYKNGKILFASGVPDSDEITALISIDVKNKKQEFLIDLAEIGLVNPQNRRDNAFEPEGVIIHNGQLMICYRSAIYTFDLKKIILSPTNEKSNNIRNI